MITLGILNLENASTAAHVLARAVFAMSLVFCLLPFSPASRQNGTAGRKRRVGVRRSGMTPAVHPPLTGKRRGQVRN